MGERGGVNDVRDEVRLEGAPNFRGLGGLTTLDGRRVRPGTLFRSEGPAHFSERDVATLRTLGIRTVCDLRSDAERSAHPNHWCSDTALLHIDIAIDVRVVGNRAWDLMRADPTPAGGRAAMGYNYRAMGRSMAGAFRQLIDHLLQPRKVPVLIHCTGGKDRTGVMMALLLHALGMVCPNMAVAHVFANHCAILGFYQSVVITLSGPAFGLLDQKRAQQLGHRGIEELAAVIGVEAEDAEGKLLQHGY